MSSPKQICGHFWTPNTLNTNILNTKTLRMSKYNCIHPQKKEKEKRCKTFSQN